MEDRIDRTWEQDVLPAMAEYVRIPALSPAYDPSWATAGHIEAAARQLAEWCRRRAVPGVDAGGVEVIELAGRTPVLFAEVAATDDGASAAGERVGTVLVYGHLDKQPPLGHWRDGLGPYEPVRDGDRLYGRGTADDGYSVFAAMTALEALAAAGTPHPRVVVLIEASEESGSPDLPAHLAALGPRLGRPGLVICLDSGCLTYDRLWRTASLRGALVATVRVDVLTEGVHSGLAGALVPTSFRLVRQLLSRVEDERTGELRLPELTAPVPAADRANLSAVAAELPEAAAGSLPTVPGLALGAPDAAGLLVAKAWAPSLAVVGIDGVPAVVDGGNVLRPYTEVKLSMRLPPSVDPDRAAAALVTALTADPPEGARVTVEVETAAPGWVAPDPEPWVTDVVDRASRRALGLPAAVYGEGGTIPFLSMLGAQFPHAQMVALGVLGPGSNAHGPNECLHLPTAKAVTLAVAELVAAAGAHWAADGAGGPGAGSG